jgi:hypothetical protein
MTAIAQRIFVVGFPRSGTTLVQSLLASHVQVTSFTESHFFSRHFVEIPGGALLTRDPAARVHAFLAENGEAPTESSAWFDRWPPALRAKPLLPLQTHAVARRLVGVFDEIASRRGRAVWLEKTPMHLRAIPLLERISRGGPPTDFVHVIRDGVDAVASLREASRHWEEAYDLKKGAARWNADMRRSLARAGAPRHHFVVYEAMATEPEATLGRLIEALGLPPDVGLLERREQTARAVVTRDETWKAARGPRITVSRAAERLLEPDDRARVAGWLRQELYERARDLASAPVSREPGAPGAMDATREARGR